MDVRLGTVIGEGEVFGSNVLNITTTQRISHGTPTEAKSIGIMISSKDSLGDVTATSIHDHDGTLPIVTDNAPTLPPYIGLKNKLMGTICGHTAASLATTPPYSAGPWLHARNGYAYLIRQTLETGSIITIDMSAWGTFDWLAARLHYFSGMELDNYVGTPNFLEDPYGGITIFYDYVFGTPSTAGTLYIPGNSVSPGDPSVLTGYMAMNAVSSKPMTFTFMGGDLGGLPEQYGFSLSGAGHTGYAFHDFRDTAPSQAMWITFSGTPARQIGWAMQRVASGPGWPYPPAGRSFSDINFRANR